MILQNISPSEYFKLPRLSNSGLTEIKDMLIGRNIPPSQQAFRFGSLLDAMLTQRHNIEVSGASSEMMQMVLAMSKAWRKYELSATYDLMPSQVVHVEDVFGVEGKCMFDKQLGKVGLDFKTTAAIDLYGFEKTIQTFDYDRQAAWYMEVGGVDFFTFIAFSKKYPHKEPIRLDVKRGDKLHGLGCKKIEWILENRNK